LFWVEWARARDAESLRDGTTLCYILRAIHRKWKTICGGWWASRVQAHAELGQRLNKV